MSKPRILVFDSGVGGLSVLQEIQNRLPSAQYVYVSDNAAFPYGTKSETFLIERVLKVLEGVINVYGADLIVIACNTASTLTLPHLRSHFAVPVVGVVPAIKPAATVSRTKVIGLLATPATVSRPYTKQLIAEFASNCSVILVGSSELVQLAEQKLRGQAVESQAIDHILALFTRHEHFEQLDTLVLACTHFPLLNEEIEKGLLRLNLRGVKLIDSGEAIARRVTSLLESSFAFPDDPSCEDESFQNVAVFTADSPEVAALQGKLGAYQLNRLDIIIV